MQLKYSLVLLAVALCSVQAKPMDAHYRNKRSADDLMSKATSVVSSTLQRVQSAAGAGLEQIYNMAEDMEEQALDTINSALESAGIKVDVKALTYLLKGEIKSCAATDDVVEKAVKIRDDVLSCFSDDLDSLKSMITDINTIVEKAQSVPKLLEKAGESCKAEDGEYFGFARLTRCASGIRSALEESDLASLPSLIANNVSRASKLAVKIRTTVPGCLSTRVMLNAASIKDLAESMSTCVRSGLSTRKSAATIAKAAPQLAAIQTVARVANLLG